MSLVSIVGLNKALPFQSALSMTTRGFHAGMYALFPRYLTFQRVRWPLTPVSPARSVVP